tara:strand:+ start:416 stop:793 length:378 start_codon:yes stop_codon:yes gene_type:complete
MSNRLYTEDHEWVVVMDDHLLVGITNHAVEELGEIVYVELPENGHNVLKGDEFGSVESVKTVSGLYSPVDGTVIDQNSTVVDTPELINRSSYEDGWLIKIARGESDDFDDLMTESEYKQFIENLD